MAQSSGVHPHTETELRGTLSGKIFRASAETISNSNEIVAREDGMSLSLMDMLIIEIGVLKFNDSGTFIHEIQYSASVNGSGMCMDWSRSVTR